MVQTLNPDPKPYNHKVYSPGMVADTSSATHLISTSKKHDAIIVCRVKVKDAFEVDIV